MINIRTLPNIIVINCVYADRLREDTRRGEDMRKKLSEAFDQDEFEYLTEYKDFDMDIHFVIKVANENRIGLSTALSIIGTMEEVYFCGCFCLENIISMEITDEYCLFEIDTESG